MNGNTLVVEWDDSKLKEIEDAKTIYRQARQAGRVIVDMVGNTIDGFKSSLKSFKVLEKALSETQFSMRIINDTGDELVIWDSNIKKEVKEAGKLFEKYLNKGWKAYAINDDGTKGIRIVSFDADLEEVVFDDKTSINIKKFAESFGKVQLLPKTRAA